MDKGRESGCQKGQKRTSYVYRPRERARSPAGPLGPYFSQKRLTIVDMTQNQNPALSDSPFHAYFMDTHSGVLFLNNSSDLFSLPISSDDYTHESLGSSVDEEDKQRRRRLRPQCAKCMLIHEKHANVLQYKESKSARQSVISGSSRDPPLQKCCFITGAST